MTDLDRGKGMPTNPKDEKMKEQCFKSMKAAEGQETLTYLSEMATIKQQLNLDEQYCKKFGLLKKASVLAFYGRDKDAKREIATAATIV